MFFVVERLFVLEFAWNLTESIDLVLRKVTACLDSGEFE